ncbi:hypothetical protein BOX15_Mlig002625g1 [Macrostomum lignano]|uniref:Uncharacterized protein n=1 Tax=Macrostomum lignano TaxID=282301 RepID=A0A267EQS3_9PLAT|nr:hypothetical protein BOX15_Mlig002625g1 [Macrostomum lignano]
MTANPIQQLAAQLKNFKAEKARLEERNRTQEAVVEQQKLEIAELKRQHAEALEKQRDELSAQFKEDLSAEQEKHRVEIEQLQSSHQADGAALVEQHEKALATEKQTCKKQMDAICAFNLKSENDLKAKHAAELEQLNQKLAEAEHQLEKTKSDYDLHIEDLLHELLSDSSQGESALEPKVEARPSAGAPAALGSEELRALKATNDDLQKQLADANRKVVVLNLRLEQLQEQFNAERNTQREQSSSESDRLKHRILKLEAELKEERNLLSKAKESQAIELGMARKEADTKAAKLSACKEQLKQASDRAASTSQEVQRLQRELDTQQSTEEALRKSLTEVQKKLEEMEQSDRRLQKKLAETEANLQQKLSSAEEALADKQRKLSSAEEALADNRRKLSVAEDSLADKQRKLSAAERELADKQQELSACQERENNYRARVDELLDRHRAQADEHDGRVAELKQREERLYQRMNEETWKRKEAEQSRSVADEQIRQLRASLDSERKSTAEQVQQAQQQRDSALSTAERMRECLEQRQRRLDQLEQGDRELQQDICRKNDECKRLETRLTQLQAKLEEAQQELKQNEDTKNLLQSTLKDYERDFAQERAEKEKYKADCTKLRESLNLRIDEEVQQQQQQQEEQQQKQNSDSSFFGRYRKQ